MRKTITWLLLAAMLAAPAGFASAAFNEEGFPIVDEPITLHAVQYQLENQQVDFDNLWFYNELEDKTGISITFEPIKDGDWRTKTNLMFASGDYPDLIIGGASGTVDVEEYGVAQGILIPLEEGIDKYMPIYKERLALNDSNASIPASDGHSYFIGNLTAQNINHDGNHFINKAWLDKLGLEIPTTIDELTDVLRAFKTGDPNGNGEADELPMIAADLIHQTQGVYTHFASFGVPLNNFVYAAVDADDSVYFIADAPGFRAANEWLHTLYAEGLLDPESITQDSNVWGTKMNAQQSGYTTYLRLINTALQPEIAEQFVSIIPPKAEGFDVQVPVILELPTQGALLTIANEHVPETLRWLDAQMETETMLMSINGPLYEGAPIEPTLGFNAETGKYEVLSIPENNGLYSVVPVTHGQFFAPGDYYFDIFTLPPHRIERAGYSKDYADADALEPTSFYYLYKLVKPSNTEAQELARLFTQIETFMKESISNFIVNGVTDESWETFQSQAKSLGSDDYVALYQKAYDEYLAANK
ncbi:MAG: extracellular solute-binding protein [Oscillospiraceae bacterium]|jgi:putative aldouronate transport system substrate-binding protein|nr:extracellular solute-binding protein [Oscillospiraceae bacterium]